MVGSYYRTIRKAMAVACELLCESNIQQFLKSFNHVLTDCDGVLWHGNNPIPGAASTLNRLRKMGKDVYFVTNNSTKTREEYLEKCTKLGFDAKENEIFSTSFAAASYLQSLNFNKKVYVVGSKGITQELDRVQIRHLGSGPDVMQGNVIDWILGGVELDPEVGAVIVGFDEHVSYPKILKAASYLSDPECIFLGTNRDERFPLENGKIVMPGSGSIVAAVKTAAEREPIMLGKPTHYLFDSITSQHNVNPEKTLMIGDRLNTDILLGSNCGLKTLLVLTGISSLDEVQRCSQSKNADDQKLIPNFYIESIGTLGKLLEQTNI